MGAHPWTQQNISTGVKYFAGLGPQSLLFCSGFFFLAFFLFNIAASLSTSKCRTWTVRLSYPFEKPDRTPGSSAVSQTEMCTVTKSAFIRAPAQAAAASRAERSRRRALLRRPLPRAELGPAAPAQAPLRRQTQPAHREGGLPPGASPAAQPLVSGLKFGPAEVEGLVFPTDFPEAGFPAHASKTCSNHACRSGTYLELKQSILVAQSDTIKPESLYNVVEIKHPANVR